ncbi:diacylglycerol/lipid kinase family protein [Aureimonas leprariae]|uniref:Diacylglycerol kinase n=1 Tax=Plantimonas leprariae TaxID=2615207 RepID=A0A7V7TWN8_9HYPH|nr:diacylglycerol kinase family protein [Aureimonas leprariae]KAB0679874.1 diacylglycerol kinase [Aureimonas leprariae]
MKIHVVLNADGGTLRTMDLDALKQTIESEFRLHGHEIDTELPHGSELGEAIEKAAKRDDIDVLVVGGGDGTVSSAAGKLMGRHVALGVLPAGTMNLFARTLQIPLQLPQAIAALAEGEIAEVDIATVNGRPFVHQFAVGMHARMVRIRERLNYGSKVGKVLASWRAIFGAVRRLPIVELEVELKGETKRLKTPALAISNNLYGEGHLPYADDPQGGELGIYICQTTDRLAVAKLTLAILFGTWRNSPSLGVYTADRVVFDYRHRHRRDRAVRDGELEDVEVRSEVVLHKRALKVLVPAGTKFQQTAAEVKVATLEGASAAP